MTVKFGFPAGGRVSINGQTVEEWGVEPEPIESLTALGGRLNVIDGVLTNPSVGTAVPRAGGKTSLALWDVRNDTTITATLDGNPVTIPVSRPLQARAFASGKHYWLAQDPVTGRFKPEPGRNHRKIYLSGSASAMTRAMIAAHAGVTEATVTGAWLLGRPQYGGSEAMPVAIDVWMLLLPVIQKASLPGCSAWVRLERGYSYALTAPHGIKGESELHPFVIEAWGTGARPVLTSGAYWSRVAGPRFMLFRDLSITTFNPKMGYGVIFENCVFDGGTSYNQLRPIGMATMRECVISDVARTTPESGTKWDGSTDRCSGLFASGADDVMLDSLVVDRNGWAEGYDFNRDGSMPMAPSDRNHGLYLTFTCHNFTIRDNLVTRNSSCGIQARMGGTFERIFYADNNIAGGLNSGSSMGAINNYINVLDNVNFGAGFKRVVSYQGGINWGLMPTGPHTSMIGCIVAHLANPDDPAEIADRTGSNSAYKTGLNYFYNDVQVYKFNGSPTAGWTNERVEGVSPTTLDQTTLHRYAATLLNQSTATIDDLVRYLRDETEGQIGKTVRDAIRWAKARFGSPLPALRSTPGNLVFQPDPRTEGFRWDNRLNWTTLDLPGTHVADSVDLAGNFVRFGTVDASIAALKSGGGVLDVTSGKLVAGSITDALTATVCNSGQIVLPATTQALDLKASGGRTILTGAVSNLALETRGNAEVLLGPDATIPVGKSLLVSGQRTMVGWDGTGSASLKVDGTLEFRPGTTVKLTGDDQWEKQYLFLTGNAVTGTNFSAILTDYEEGRALYLSDLVGTPQANERIQYGVKIETSETQNEDIPQYATIGSITSRSFSPLQVFRSGAIGDGITEPTVAATVLLRAGSVVKVDATGLVAGTYPLTGSRVTVTNQGATLPAGVTVTGGALVLTVS